MDKRSRRRFSNEFKAETVALVRHSGKSIAEVCRDIRLAESTVHRWLAQAEIDGGQRDGLRTGEREELSRLRRELRMHVRCAACSRRAAQARPTCCSQACCPADAHSWAWRRCTWR
jgi:transposase